MPILHKTPNSILALLLVLSVTGPQWLWAEEEGGESDEQNSEAASEQVIPEVPRVGSLDAYQMAQQTLADESAEHEVVWLEVQYPGWEEPYRVLALQQQPRVPEVQGAVLLLHDLEQHADWPYLIRPLRQALPDAGWFTLSLNLPDDGSTEVPERTLAPKERDELVVTPLVRAALEQAAMKVSGEGGAMGEASEDAGAEESGESGDAPAEDEEPAEEAAPNECGDGAAEEAAVDIDLEEKKAPARPPVAYADRAQLHLKAALDFIDKEGYQNIILVGYRHGANTVLEYVEPVAKTMPATGFALVLIDPELKTEYQVELGKSFGKKFKPPVLDIYNSIDLQAPERARQREAGARMAEMANYRQIKLNTLESGNFQETIIRRVKAWMMTQAPGMSATRVMDRRR